MFIVVLIEIGHRWPVFPLESKKKAYIYNL